MKRFIYLGILVIFIFVILGCKAKEPINPDNDNEQISENEQLPGEPDEEDQSIGIPEYEYYQELNIIEDNYRTYYEVFLYSFYDSDGDGIGDIKGLIEQLDYINDGDPDTDTDLGFNGIWLMPIMPSNTYHKYDVKDYYDIDPEYGTLSDFKRLVDECNKRGIKLIIDLVLNHSSQLHP
jgi:1,4-alpha-glucan branching enzyme